MKLGDSVRVKEGIMCPDQEDLPIGGWQGRVVEVIKDEDGNDLIGIKWDSITLKNMPASFIDQCEEEGTDYTTIYLAPEEVEPAVARDKIIQAAFGWQNYHLFNFDFGDVVCLMIQSAFAPALFEIIAPLFKENDYLELLKKHYYQFKTTLKNNKKK